METFNSSLKQAFATLENTYGVDNVTSIRTALQIQGVQKVIGEDSDVAKFLDRTNHHLPVFTAGLLEKLAVPGVQKAAANSLFNLYDLLGRTSKYRPDFTGQLIDALTTDNALEAIGGKQLSVPLLLDVTCDCRPDLTARLVTVLTSPDVQAATKKEEKRLDDLLEGTRNWQPDFTAQVILGVLERSQNASGLVAEVSRLSKYTHSQVVDQLSKGLDPRRVRALKQPFGAQLFFPPGNVQQAAPIEQQQRGDPAPQPAPQHT